MQSFTRALEIDPTIQLSKGIETRRGQRRRSPRRSATRGRRPRRAAAATTTPRRRPGRSAAARSWRGTTRRPRRGSTPPRKKKRRPERRRGARSAGPHRRARLPERRTRRSSTSRSPSAARWPPTCRWPASTCMYRAPGKEEYNEVQMTKTPKGWLPGQDPQEGGHREVDPVLLRGAQRRRQAGRRQRRRRQPEHRAGRRGGGGRRGRRRRGEPARRTRTRSRRTRGTSGRSSASGAPTRTREGLDTRYGKRKWWIGIGVGTGYGYAKGNGFEAVNKSTETIPLDSACCDSSRFHCLPVPAGARLGRARPPRARGRLRAHARTWRCRSRGASSTSRRIRSTRSSPRTGAIGVPGQADASTRSSRSSASSGPSSPAAATSASSVYPDAGSRRNGVRPTSRTPSCAGPLLVGAGGGLYYEATQGGRRWSSRCTSWPACRPSASSPTCNLSLQFNIYSRDRRRGPKAATSPMEVGSRRAEIVSAAAGTRARDRRALRLGASASSARRGRRAAQEVRVAPQRAPGRGLPEDRARRVEIGLRARRARPGTARARGRAACRRPRRARRAAASRVELPAPPKSASTTSPGARRSRFDGLRSPWTIPPPVQERRARRAGARAVAADLRRPAARPGARAGAARSVPPAIHSIASARAVSSTS